MRRFDHKRGNKKESGIETLLTGLVFTGVFGVVWFLRGDWWWVFPLAFAGILPILEGIRKMIKERKAKKIAPDQYDTASEKKVLLVAQQENGKVTPALIALKSDLSLDRAEKILEKMVKQGHATMNILDAGRIEYEFPEFSRGIEKDE